jgi:transcriptional regulator with XRE-family HTH domain
MKVQQLSAYETGQKTPGVAVLARIADITGTSIDFIFRGAASAAGKSAVQLHRCQFLDFVAMIAEYHAMRRVLLALRERRQERKEAEAVLDEAIRLKKLEANL